MRYRLRRADGLWLAYRGDKMEWTAVESAAHTWRYYADIELALRWIQTFFALPIEVVPEDDWEDEDIPDNH